MRVNVPKELYIQYRLYAVLKHVSPKAAITYALADWMESIGQGHIEDACAIDPLARIVDAQPQPITQHEGESHAQEKTAQSKQPRPSPSS